MANLIATDCGCGQTGRTFWKKETPRWFSMTVAALDAASVWMKAW